MRVRVTHRLALLGALAVVATTLGVAQSPATRAYASPLTANDFHEVALQGFGDRANSWAWSMAWYKNRLYVGTNRNFDCFQEAALSRIFLPYPPPDPDVLCPGSPPRLPALAPTLGAQIWSVDPSSTTPLTQSNWQEAYQDPATIPMTVQKQAVFGPRDEGWRGMSVFNEADGTQALYISGVGLKPLATKSAPPPALLRTTDGVNYQAVPADPGTTMGDINTLTTIPSRFGKGACCIRGQVTYKGNLVVTIGSLQGAGAVFASPNPSQGDNSFVQITPADMKVFEIEPFNGHLYLGVQSLHNGYSVLRTDCITPPSGQVGCNASDFTQVVPPGGGLGKNGNGFITSMHVFTDTNGVAHLYVGTDGAPNKQAAEIVRVNTDDSWDLVVGDPRTVNGKLMTPLSGLTSGFGWYYNWHMWRMEDYQGVLYVGTFDSSTTLKDKPQGQALRPYMGFDLWASPDGVNFVPVTQNGFGDMFSFGARTLKATPFGLFLGSANFYYGLRIWQGSLNPAALQLAPKDLQSDVASTPGAVSLAWDAPNGAKLYHVYRATATQIATPAFPDVSLDPESNDPSAQDNAPSTIWVPGQYTEIGATTTPYFVDDHAPSGGHDTYYVVAQDASGRLSTPSNAIMAAARRTLPTFGYMKLAVAYLAIRNRLTPTQAGMLNRGLTSAQTRLRSGDAQGARSQLASLRQQLLSSAQGATDRLDAERVAVLLARLEKRLLLVGAHVLSSSQIN